MPESHQGCLPGRYWGLGRYPDSSDRDLDTEIWMFRANRNFTRVPLHNAFTTLWFGKKKNKSRHQDKKDFNDLDVLLTSPGPLWLMMSIGAFGHFFAYTLSIYLLNVCLKFLLFATDWHRQATARDAEKFLCTRIDYHQQIQAAATRRYNLFTSSYGQMPWRGHGRNSEMDQGGGKVGCEEEGKDQRR